MTSKVSSLNGLFDNILEGARFVARERTVMQPLVTNVSGEGMAPRIGGEYNSLTVATVAEGAEPTAQEFTKSTAYTLTPVRLVAQAFVTDQRLATDPDNTETDVAREMGFAMAEQVDRTLTGLFGSFTASKGTAGSVTTLQHVAAACSRLNGQNAQGNMNVVLHPYAWHNIWLGLGMPSASQAFLGDVANEALRQYYVGTFVGANWYETNNVGTAGGTAINGVFVQSALTLDTRKGMTIEAERDASREGNELNMTMWVANGVTRNAWGVKVIGTAVEPS